MTEVSERPAGAALKRVLIGSPRSSDDLGETLLSKKLALPIFASDPLSSVAYATEAALVVLVAASLTAAHLVLPISIAISVLLAIVVLSYRQTVRAYETSGGAYVVARDNLGTTPSLVAAAALLVDYVLTVAVSVTAGVVALTSAASGLESHKVDDLAWFRPPAHAREPARRARIGHALCDPDVRFCRGHVCDGRDRRRQLRGRHMPASACA